MRTVDRGSRRAGGARHRAWPSPAAIAPTDDRGGQCVRLQRCPICPRRCRSSTAQATPISLCAALPRRCPMSRRSARSRVADPGQGYGYADMPRFSYDEALGDAPPDYAFDYDGVDPWAWQGYDNSIALRRADRRRLSLLLLSSRRDDEPYFVQRPVLLATAMTAGSSPWSMRRRRDRAVGGLRPARRLRLALSVRAGAICARASRRGRGGR